MIVDIHSLEETKEFASKVASCIKGKQIVITLDGDIGAGKTTFTILKSYKQENGEPLHHIDAYRLEGSSQDLGFEDCFDEGICVVEWSQFIEDQLPEDRLKISIEEGLDENRKITVESTGPVSQSIMEDYYD